MKSIHKVVVLLILTARGVANLVVHGTSGSTSYETIPPGPPDSSGGVLSTVDMVVQRRNDDDDNDMLTPSVDSSFLNIHRILPLSL